MNGNSHPEIMEKGQLEIDWVAVGSSSGRGKALEPPPVMSATRTVMGNADFMLLGKRMTD